MLLVPGLLLQHACQSALTQSFSVWSSLAVHRYVPLLLHATSQIPCECPDSVAVHSPLPTSQILAVLSAPAETMRLPSPGLNLQLTTALLCPTSTCRCWYAALPVVMLLSQGPSARVATTPSQSPTL